MNKPDRYAAAGLVMADTANMMGLGPVEFDAWGGVMRKLAGWDDESETGPGVFSTPAHTLEYLGLDTANPNLTHHARQLAEASDQAHQANTVGEHFDCREAEAVHVVGLLRHSDESGAGGPAALWTQLARVAVAGNYLDSVMDASEDAKRMPQFTARQLAYGGLQRFRDEQRALDRSTKRALVVATIRHDLQRQWSKPLLTTASLVRVSLSPAASRTSHDRAAFDPAARA